MALEYFTEAELRALPQVSNTTKYPLARVEVVASQMVSDFELFCGVSFLPRTHVELHSGIDVNAQGGSLVLRARRPLAVTALEVDGVALTAGELLELRINGGVVRRYSTGAVTPLTTWSAGRDNIEVTYTAGFAAVPSNIKEAALQATRARLIETSSNSDYDPRRTSMTTEAGTVNYATAGGETPTGYPDVDAVLQAYRKTRSPLVF